MFGASTVRSQSAVFVLFTMSRRYAQEEVAQRLIRDDAGASDYRPMSVRVHYYSEPYYIRPVTATCFDPAPNVESCLVGFRPKPRDQLLPLAGTHTQFFTFVQSCFAQKRKMLKNNMKAVCSEVGAPYTQTPMSAHVICPRRVNSPSSGWRTRSPRPDEASNGTIGCHVCVCIHQFDAA
jgi:16S rRNA A1518/A1519 N6-dimethyltransferase RsmA/KsgA/DIM1 with predicted DNA glycosylase/AP lyase activity